MKKNILIISVVLGVALCCSAEAEAEIIQVPAYGPGYEGPPTVTSSVLEAGQLYRIEARGTFGYDSVNSLADAEWVHDDTWPPEDWVEHYAGSLTALDLLVNETPQDWMGTTDGVDFSPHIFSPTHVYRLEWLGTGQAITFWIDDRPSHDNTGFLEVEITRVAEPPCWQEQQKLLASDGAAYDLFGGSASIDGAYTIVGAVQDNSNTGAAYIFKYDGDNWSEQIKLTASDGGTGDYFGGVSISGHHALVSAHFQNNSNGNYAGAAYIFKRTGETWAEQAKLIASDGASGDEFAGSVCISEDIAVLGARFDDDNGYSSGSAYVFAPNDENPNNWDQQAKLTASDGSSGDWFGIHVSIDGDYAIVGAERDDDKGSDSGSVYIFKRDGENWYEQCKLTASDGASEDQFGAHVSIDGNYAIIGARYDDDNGSNSGSAYIFKRDGENWYEQIKLIAEDGTAGDGFGVGVTINENYAIVTAPYDDDNGDSSGSAYVFQREGENWIQRQKLLPSDSAADDYFGLSVSISGDNMIIGAYKDDDNGLDSGSAYVLKNICEPMRVQMDIKPQSCPNPLNVKSKGNICVAILGSEEFDANAIDPASIRLKYGDDGEGVAPIRSSLEDVAAPIAEGAMTGGPIAYWPFDGDANDESGNANHGTEHGGPSYVGGVCGQAIGLDGLDDYVMVPKENAPQRGLYGTVAGWVKIPSTFPFPQWGAGFVNKMLHSTGRYQYEIAIGHDGPGWGSVGDGLALSCATCYAVYWQDKDTVDPRLLFDDRWHHLSITWTPTELTLYVDGFFENSVIHGYDLSIPDPMAWDLNIGRRAYASPTNWKYLEGAIDEVRIYDRALPASEISELADTSCLEKTCECTTEGPDGYTDLTVKFDTQLVLAAIGDVNSGDVLQLDLTGLLDDGTAIQGTDCMVVLGNFKAFKKGDINKDGITDAIDFTLMAETWLESTIIQEE